MLNINTHINNTTKKKSYINIILCQTILPPPHVAKFPIYVVQFKCHHINVY